MGREAVFFEKLALEREIAALSRVSNDSTGVISDPLHMTALPFKSRSPLGCTEEDIKELCASSGTVERESDKHMNKKDAQTKESIVNDNITALTGVSTECTTIDSLSTPAQLGIDERTNVE